MRQGRWMRREFEGNKAFFLHVAEFAVIVGKIHVIALAVVAVAVIFQRAVFKDVAYEILRHAVGVKSARSCGAKRRFVKGVFGRFVVEIQLVCIHIAVNGGRVVVSGKQFRAGNNLALFRNFHVVRVGQIKEQGRTLRVFVKAHVVLDDSPVNGVSLGFFRRHGGEYENKRAGERRA